MKRKYISVLLVCLLAVLLTACGEVKNCEEAIDAIGTVTLDSKRAIVNAERLYTELGNKQSRVDNATVLMAARDEYDRLYQLAQNAENAALEISAVNPDSGEAIRTARDICAMLTTEGMTEEAEELLSAIEAAQVEFDRQRELMDTLTKAVNAVGTVTPDDGTRLEAAWAAYAVLEQENIAQYADSDYQNLKKAQDTYDKQCELVAQYIDAVNGLGTITLDSRFQLDQVAAFYTRLTGQGIASYVAEYKAVANAAEAEYLALYSADFYKTAKAQYNKKEYEEVRTQIAAFLREYPTAPNAEELRTLRGKCLIEMARAKLNQGLTEAALNIMNKAESYEKAVDGYQTLLTQIQNRITANRPYTGRKLYNNLGSGYGQLVIEASSTADACVKLESIDNPDKYVLFYVRAGEKATISVPAGKYYLKYTSGSTWYSTEEMFGASASYTKAEDIFEFTVSYSGNYVYYNQITVTLYTVWGGNLETTPITENGF